MSCKYVMVLLKEMKMLLSLQQFNCKKYNKTYVEKCNHTYIHHVAVSLIFFKMSGK